MSQIDGAHSLLRVHPFESKSPACRVDPQSDPEKVFEDSGLLGVSEPMQALRREIRRLAASSNPRLRVLLTGEVGVGKSSVARLLHRLGMRQGGPFKSLNCGAIPSTLMESELFGIERRTATGVDPRPGYLERSAGGVLLLDEIGDLPLEQQSKFLLVLSEYEFLRLGGDGPKPFDAWLVCATSRDLREMATLKSFRGDLLSRLWSNHIEIPSLVKRGPQDIELLLLHHVRRCLANRDDIAGGNNRTSTLPPVRLTDVFTPAAQHFMLREYRWPWNIRELVQLFENERILTCVRSGGEAKIDRIDLERELCGGGVSYHHDTVPHAGSRFTPLHADATLKELQSWYEQVKVAHFARMLERTTGNVADAARRLACDRGTVYLTLKLHPCGPRALPREGGL